MRKPLPHRDDAIGDLGRRRMRAAPRRMAQFLEPARLSALPAPFPNVERLTADAVPPAQIANRENARLVVPKQRDTLFHRTGLLERHRPISSNQATTLTCQESTRSKLSGLSPEAKAQKGFHLAALTGGEIFVASDLDQTSQGISEAGTRYAELSQIARDAKARLAGAQTAFHTAAQTDAAFKEHVDAETAL